MKSCFECGHVVAVSFFIRLSLFLFLCPCVFVCPFLSVALSLSLSLCQCLAVSLHPIVCLCVAACALCPIARSSCSPAVMACCLLSQVRSPRSVALEGGCPASACVGVCARWVCCWVRAWRRRAQRRPVFPPAWLIECARRRCLGCSRQAVRAGHGSLTLCARTRRSWASARS